MTVWKNDLKPITARKIAQLVTVCNEHVVFGADIEDRQLLSFSAMR
jgi:hypothetical protein